MNDADPLNDVVSGQYERWVYPAPILDLPGWLEHNWQWFDPSHAAPMLWPDRGYRPGLDILVAGCGTNQAAVIAYTNPTARVVALDVSEASLAHHRYLAEKYELVNLELHRLPIEECASLGADFDLVITTGVLHHLADPAVGMRALGQCLRVDGVLAVMLYATCGRIGVQLLQSAFRDLELGQDEESLLVVRDALAQLGPDHPVAGYLGIAPDLEDDAGLVDTFLHGRERDYTIGECRALVASAGLVFQDVFLKSPYYAPRGTTSEFLCRVAALPREQQWAVMERVNTRNACHFFLACRPERPRSSYDIDFDSREFDSRDPLRFVPSLRHACRLDGDTLRRHDWQVTLDAGQAQIAARMDGHRTIAQIVDATTSSGPLARVDNAEVRSQAVELFRSLWQADFVALGLPPTPGGG
ncbi:MAG: class I SAM-dependent methyltransferase [bacterium]